MNCPDYQCILDNNDIKRKKSIRTNFRAFVVNQTGEGLTMGIQRLSLQDFPPGEVLIQVGYAAMNYKDALVCTATGKVAQTYPLVPGLEFAGEVVESRDQRFMSGDEVLASDFGSTLGISRYGGYSEYARIPGEMLFPLARELDCKQALVLSAGMTVALALHHLEKNGLTPRSGPVLATGATGEVGSLAVSLLSQRWAGSIDTVGGTTLAYLMRTTKKDPLCQESKLGKEEKR